MQMRRWQFALALVIVGAAACDPNPQRVAYQECLADWDRYRKKGCGGDTCADADLVCGVCQRDLDELQLVTCDRLRPLGNHPPAWPWMHKLGRRQFEKSDARVPRVKRVGGL